MEHMVMNKVVDLFRPNLEQALGQWEKILPVGHVLPESACGAYDNCPSQIKRRVCAALLPTSVEEIQAVVRIANEFKIPLYPISRGNNWGFGGANPTLENCVILDLSHLNTIRDFDADLGIITVEPGVTQQQISDFLDQHGSEFMLSTIPAGPNCSYLANALERGSGMIPPVDRFLSLTSLKAVLPDGSLYQSLMSDAGAEQSDRVYKWGVGPYLDGLFSQGNFGVVTEASFALARRSEEITRFYFSPRPGVTLVEMMNCLRRVKQALRGVMNTFELGNRTEAVYGARKSGETLCPMYDYMHWTVYGSLHASRRVSKAAIADMKAILKPVCQDFVFLTRDTLEKVKKYPFLFPRTKNWTYVVKNQDRMMSYMGLYEGKPDTNHLMYAYSRLNGDKRDLNIEKDMKKSGLIWFWPILPLKGEDIDAFLQMLNKTSAGYGITPNLNITVGSETHAVANVHIFFDPATQSDQARAFHKQLFEESRALGYLPVRPHIEAISWYMDHASGTVSQQVLQSFKDALDPNNIMAPGKYTI